jgi:hypothetical protein
VVPVASWYLPAAHARQAEEVVADWYHPVEHAVHADAAAAEYFPTAHASVTAVRPVVAQ